MAPDLAFNTAASFTTNTNWQAYVPETTMSYLTQMAGLAYHNFISAAVGIALAIAIVRGIARREQDTLGNFWVDMTRATFWVLMPICILGALFLVWQGVPQNFKPYATAQLVDPQTVQTTDSAGKTTTQIVKEQTIAQGPIASQEMIKELGTNGGGFFNANSAHPYENPTPLTNFFELVLIFAIGSALTYTLGQMTGSPRHGWAVWCAMAILFLVGVTAAYSAEARGNPLVQTSANHLQPAGNMEGKEVRFGIANSALWAVVTTDTSCGAVNSMHDSYTPLGGMIPLINMLLGEVVFGGVGSGLYGIIVFIILSVFIAGLMVGRTPEYLGKKIEAFDVKMAMLTVLIYPLHGADLHRHFRRCAEVRIVEPRQRGAAWTVGNLLCLRGSRRKQRLGIRRTQRQHPLVQLDARHDHAVRPVFHGHSGAGDRRKPGAKEACPGIIRHVPGDDAAVHRPVDLRDFDCWRADFFPGAQPGPDSRAPADVRREDFLRKIRSHDSPSKEEQVDLGRGNCPPSDVGFVRKAESARRS